MARHSYDNIIGKMVGSSHDMFGTMYLRQHPWQNGQLITRHAWHDILTTTSLAKWSAHRTTGIARHSNDIVMARHSCTTHMLTWHDTPHVVPCMSCEIRITLSFCYMTGHAYHDIQGKIQRTTHLSPSCDVCRVMYVLTSHIVFIIINFRNYL